MMEKKILFVDDEERILDMLEKLFSRANYTVRCAESAEKALDILRQESIMVMALDLKLPAMNGVELCKHIRKKNPICIIYALTGYANLFSLLECRGAGFDDLFIKPVNPEVLLKAFQEAFEKIERWEIPSYDLM
jgi:DNA-binding response OmpR family regulator